MLTYKNLYCSLVRSMSEACLLYTSFRFVHRAVRSTVRSAMPLPRSFFAIDTAKYRISSIA